MRPYLFAALFFCTLSQPLFALDYVESSNGDLSNDRSAPTLWGTLPVGSNFLTGTTSQFDLDYFTINIPAGEKLSGLKMVSFDSGDTGDETGFIGVQIGTVMTVAPDAQSAAGLLGWSHFGPGVGDVGLDILPFIGSQGFGSTGFVPPLPSNNYTFWIQQLNFDPTAYKFEFIVSAAGVPGDYNGSGTVDAADYVQWRNGGPLANEVASTGIVDTADFDAWRARFGNSAGAGSSVTNAEVPEPRAEFLMLLCAALLSATPASRRIKSRE